MNTNINFHVYRHDDIPNVDSNNDYLQLSNIDGTNIVYHMDIEKQRELANKLTDSIFYTNISKQEEQMKILRDDLDEARDEIEKLENELRELKQVREDNSDDHERY